MARTKIQFSRVKMFLSSSRSSTATGGSMRSRSSMKKMIPFFSGFFSMHSLICAWSFLRRSAMLFSASLLSASTMPSPNPSIALFAMLRSAMLPKPMRLFFTFSRASSRSVFERVTTSLAILKRICSNASLEFLIREYSQVLIHTEKYSPSLLPVPHNSSRSTFISDVLPLPHSP